VAEFKTRDNVASCDEGLQVSSLYDPRRSTKLELEGAIRDCIALVETDRLQNCNYGPVDAQLSPAPSASPRLGSKKLLKVGWGSPIEGLGKMHRRDSSDGDVVGAHTMNSHFHSIKGGTNGWSLETQIDIMHTRPGAGVNFHCRPRGGWGQDVQLCFKGAPIVAPLSSVLFVGVPSQQREYEPASSRVDTECL
jgi:hypothetical protein